MPTLDRQRLLIRAAQLYYLDELTQTEIAGRLRLSRPQVQRLLQEARSDGTVQIAIRPVMGIYAELERELEARYGLREALVVETTAYHDQAVVAREVGAAAAAYLLRLVRPHDRIVISWGGSLLGMVNALAAQSESPELQDVCVIQGLGGLVDPNHEAHAADLTRRLAKFLGGSAQLMPAPGVVGSRRTRDAVIQDPHVAEVLHQARRATLALMGIGAPRRDSILVKEGAIVTWPELEALLKQGAVGDLNLRYFDAAGQRLASELDERVIGLTLDELKQIGNVVGIAGGAAKLKAIRGALAGHLVHALVTDQVTAHELLKPGSPSSPRNGRVASRGAARADARPNHRAT